MAQILFQKFGLFVEGLPNRWWGFEVARACLLGQYTLHRILSLAVFPGLGLLYLLVQELNHGCVSFEGPVDAARLDILVGFVELGINNTSLRGRVFVVSVGKLGAINHNLGCCLRSRPWRR